MFGPMRIGREIELRCPRCRVVAVRAPGRQESCTHCGAELVVSRSPSEALVRAYLYGGGRREPPVHRLPPPRAPAPIPIGAQGPGPGRAAWEFSDEPTIAKA